MPFWIVNSDIIFTYCCSFDSKFVFIPKEWSRGYCDEVEVSIGLLLVDTVTVELFVRVGLESNGDCVCSFISAKNLILLSVISEIIMGHPVVIS